MSHLIAHIVVPLPLEGPFDYSIPEHLRDDIDIGCRVQVSCAHQKRVGFVVGFASESKLDKLNPVLAVLDEEPVFSEIMLRFSEEFSLNFGCSRGEALELFLPAALRKARKLVLPVHIKSSRSSSRKKANRIVIFDEGLTKRWDTVLAAVKGAMEKGERVLCLVPDNFVLEEILPRFVPFVKKEEAVVLRQGTEKEEMERWQRAFTGQAKIIFGFISAVFAPVKDLGLIVVFEEDSPSYKHDQSPFYHAREAAFIRSSLEGCDVVCVTSSPSVELWKRVINGEAELVTFKDAVASVKLLDLTNFKMKKGTFLSPPLRQAMERGGKVLLYIPAAKGTQGVVDEVKTRFPHAKVFGYEKTSTALPGNFDVLVSTQAVFRHRGSLRFAMSAVLDIDWEFHKMDYRASHGAFALIQRLRQVTTGTVLLQTRNVQNEHLHDLVSGDYEAFYGRELKAREEMGLPPFAWCVTVVVRSADPELACEEAKILYDKMNSTLPDGVELMESQQDRSAILRGKHRYCVTVQGKDLKVVMALVKDALRSFRRKRDVVVTVNVNP